MKDATAVLFSPVFCLRVNEKDTISIITAND